MKKNVSNEDVLARIYRKLPYFNPALKRIGDYVINNPDKSKMMTIKELSLECKVAESSITRFVKELDYRNYRNFKFALVEVLTYSGMDEDSDDKNKEFIYEDITRDDTNDTILEKVLHRNIQTLEETKERINMIEIMKAVDMIENADNIIFSCMGSSSIAALEGVMRFIRAGKKCILLNDQSMQSMTSAIAGDNDLVIGITNSGKTKSVINVLKLAKENGARTIAITSFEDAPVNDYAHISLYTSTKSSDEGALYWEATTSKTAQILVIDLLYAAYASRYPDDTLVNLNKTYKALRYTR